MSSAARALDAVTDTISRSPVAAAGLTSGSLASASTPWLVRIAELDVVLGFVATCIGLLGACVGLAVGCISLCKALRKP